MRIFAAFWCYKPLDVKTREVNIILKWIFFPHHFPWLVNGNSDFQHCAYCRICSSISSYLFPYLVGNTYHFVVLCRRLEEFLRFCLLTPARIHCRASSRQIFLLWYSATYATVMHFTPCSRQWYQNTVHNNNNDPFSVQLRVSRGLKGKMSKKTTSVRSSFPSVAWIKALNTICSVWKLLLISRVEIK